MDRTTVRMLRNVIETALKKNPELSNFSVELGNARFDETNCRFKLNVIDIRSLSGKPGANAVLNAPEITKASVEFTKFATMFGVKPEALGASFSMRNSTYTLTGLNRRCHRYPFSVVTGRGAKYKLTAETVKRNLAKNLLVG